MNCALKESNRRILVVDDEADVLDFLKIYLESLGWQTVIVQSARAASEACAAQAFFLVITDIAMPDMDGFELVSMLKDCGFAGEFAFMTGFGYNPEHTLVKINKLYKYPYLFKPFNRKKVEEAARDAFETYHKGMIS